MAGNEKSNALVSELKSILKQSSFGKKFPSVRSEKQEKKEKSNNVLGSNLAAILQKVEQVSGVPGGGNHEEKIINNNNNNKIGCGTGIGDDDSLTSSQNEKMSKNLNQIR